MDPVRLTGSAFAEMRYATDPSPCPLADDVNPIHGACVVTLHVQSRSTVTVTLPAPPAEPKDVVGEDTFAWQREGVVLEGAATLVVAELPHATVTASALPPATIAKHSSRALAKRDGHGRGARRTLQLSCTKVASVV
jgi:hypothetical protein